MSLTLETWRHSILQQIPPCRHAEAFGSFCTSRPSKLRCHDDPAHIINMWLKTENRESLLSSCAALLCWDPSGKTMILSGPRLCINEQSPEEGMVVVAHRGNNVERSNVVSISIEELHQSVVGFVPERVHSSLEKEKMKNAKDSSCSGIDVPTYKDGSTFVAKLPVVVPLPFNHHIFEDLDAGLNCLKLGAIHPLYSTWIESTSWLCHNLQGKGLPEVAGNESDGNHAAAPSILLSPLSHEEGSAAWNELAPDLERIRNENLEKFLSANKEFYQGARGLLSPGDFAAPMEHGVSSPVQSDEEVILSTSVAQDTGTKIQVSSPEDREPALRTNRQTPDIRASCPPEPPQAVSPSEGATEIQGENGWEEAEVTPSPRLKDAGQANVAASVPSAVFANHYWFAEEAAERAPESRKRPAISHGTGFKKQRKCWGKVEDFILGSLAEFKAMHMEQVPKVLLSLFSGYANPSSVGFKDALKHLTQESLVAIQRGVVSVTALGNQYLPLVEPLKTNAEVHKRLIDEIQKKLKTKKLKEVWEVLSDGEAHDVKSVANFVGYTNVQSQGFKAAIGVLTNKLNFAVHDKSKKTLQLRGFLFPFSSEGSGREMLYEEDWVVSV